MDMLQSALLNVLVNVFGEYVEGMSKENLTLSVWDGRVSLQNLELSSRKLNRLNLPVAVHHGSISNFEVTVPWAKLDSEPVEVRIDGVCLQVGRLGEDSLSPQSIKSRAQQAKQAAIQQMEARIIEQLHKQKTNTQQSSSWGWGWGQIQQLVTKIVDNLVVTITNVHLRYEDTVTFPGQTVAVGITLESFLVRSTDHNWDITFVTRSKLPDSNSIHKLANVKNFALYWQSDSVCLEHLPHAAWLPLMLGLIATERNRRTQLNYILPPISLRLKCVHNDLISDGVPKIVAMLDAERFDIVIDRTHLTQVSLIQAELASLTLRLKFVHLRPTVSPLQDAKSWWRYAYKVVANKEQTQATISEQNKDIWWAARTMIARERYVPLFKRSKNTPGSKPLDATGIAALQRMEDALTLDTLLVLTRIAHQQLFAEEQARKAREAQEAKAKGFVGYWMGNSTEVAHHETSKEDTDFTRYELPLLDLSEPPPHPHLLSAKLALSLNLTISSRGKTVVTLTGRAAADFDLTQEGMAMNLDINGVRLIDDWSLNACYANILSVRDVVRGAALGSEQLLVLNVRKTESAMQVEMTMQQIELVLNPPCVRELLDLLNAMKPSTEVIEQVPRQTAANVASAEVPTSLSSSMLINLRCAAPKIIIPTQFDQDSGLLVMDCGDVAMHGALGVGVAKGMTWDVSVCKIEAAMPNNKTEMEALTEEVYLIHPFNIHLHVQTVNQSEADMTVQCEVEPEMRGALDAPKIRRLLRVVDVLAETFSNSNAVTVPSAPPTLHQTQSLYTYNMQVADAARQKQEKHDVQPSRASMVINVSMNTIALDLHYSNTNEARLRLGVSAFTTTVRLRPYDMVVRVALQSLLVEDSLRHASQVSLANSNLQENLCWISYTRITDTRSPLFDNCGTLIDIHLKTILLNVDSVTLSHLKPFWDALLAPRSTVSQQTQMSVKDNVLSSPLRRLAAAHFPISVADTQKNALEVMRVSAKLDQVGLELLEKPSQPGALLPAIFEVNVIGLEANLVMATDMDFHAVLDSFVITDKREITSGRPYRDLVRPLTTTVSEADKPRPLLDVTVKLQQNDTIAMVELNNLTAFFFPDLVKTALNLTFENIEALTKLFAKPEGTDPENVTEQSKENTSAAMVVPLLTRRLLVTVKIESPRVVVLEEPNQEDSKAVVATIGSTSITYKNDQETSKTAQVARVALRDVELYVAVFNSESRQLQIVDPFTLDAAVSVEMVNSRMVSLELGIDCDKIELRVSLNDMLIISHILERQSYHDDVLQEDESFALQIPESKTRQQNVGREFLLPGVVFVKINLVSVKVVLLNDSGGQSVSMLRAGVDDVVFSLEGGGNELRADGAFALSSQFFNPNISKWEPVIERWLPKLKISNTDETAEKFYVSLFSDHMLQVNLSGIMLRTLSETMSSFTRSLQMQDRSIKSLVIKNETEFEIVLLNSRTAEPLGIVAPGSEQPVSQHSQTLASHEASKHLLIDLLFTADVPVAPLKRLPTIHNCSWVMTLQPPVIQSQPTHTITEQLWEFQRRIPIKNSWGQPFLPGDPPKFSVESLERVPLPSRWTWQDEWHVDTRGATNGQVDSEGWEYGAGFTFLGGLRRGQERMLDQARRRLWVRTRFPTDSRPEVKRAVEAPLKLVWEVNIGLQTVIVRSIIKIMNRLPVPVLAVASYASGERDSVFGPISPDSHFCVPVSCAHVTSVRFQAADVASTLSDAVSCAFRPSETPIQCIETGYKTENDDFLYFIARREYAKNKDTVTVEIRAHASVQNLLPCPLYVRVMSSSGQADESSTLASGESLRLCKADPRHQPKLQYRLSPEYQWSEPRILWDSEIQGRRKSLTLPCSNASTEAKSNLTLSVKSTKDTTSSSEIGSVNICVYSRYAFVDRTDLGLCLRTYPSHDHRTFIRKTYVEQASELSPPRTVGRIGEVNISELRCPSKRRCETSSGTIGSQVYTDSDYVWTYLDAYVHGCTNIRTSDQDRHNHGTLSFKVDKDCIVYILVDSRCSPSPRWLTNNTISLKQHCIARRRSHPQDIRIYNLCAKLALNSETVSISPESTSESLPAMYTCFVRPVDAEESAAFVRAFSLQNDQMTHACEYWIDGGRGLNLFHSMDRQIFIGTRDGRDWSNEVVVPQSDITTPSIFSLTSQTLEYLLCYRLVSLPGLYSNTQMFEIMPRVCLVNMMDEPLYVREESDQPQRPLTILPFETVPWHKTSTPTSKTMIQFSVPECSWSYASVNVLEVGSFDILVAAQGNPRVLHAEVKLAEPHDFCAVCVCIWESKRSSGNEPMYEIWNHCGFQLRVCQTLKTLPQNIDPANIQFLVPPGGKQEFGWVSVGTQLVEVVVDGSNDLVPEVVDLNREGQMQQLSERSTFSAEVICCKGTKILHVHPINEEVDSASNMNSASRTNDGRSFSFDFDLNLSQLGVSIITETPVRGEILHFFMSSIQAKYMQEGTDNRSFVELTVQSLQIDNFLRDSRIYPVLLSVAPVKRRATNVEAEEQVLHMTIVRSTMADSSTPIFEYLAFKLLTLDVQVDLVTLLTFYTNFLGEWRVTSLDQLQAKATPTQWANKFTLSNMSGVQPFVDVNRAKEAAQSSRMFFSSILVHPIKVFVSFVNNSSVRAADFSSFSDTTLGIVQSLANISKAPITTSSFESRHVFETPYKLLKLMLLHNKLLVMQQLASLAGSLTIIGSPATLLRNVGEGVQDFFYEPIEGLVQSPREFCMGVQRGTSSLMKGVFSSTLNSAAGIVNTATSGIAILSGDADYAQKRSLDRHRQTNKGVLDGGAAVVRGFTDGVSGLISQPMREAQAGGAFGFVKGVGLGLLGAAVKPVLGIADGVTSVVQGMSNVLANEKVLLQIRPARPLPWRNDLQQQILLDLDLESCDAFELVQSDADKLERREVYLDRVQINERSQVMFSDTCVRVVKDKDASSMWRRDWQTITWVQHLPGASRLRIHVFNDDAPNLLVCASEELCVQTYTMFYEQQHRMAQTQNTHRRMDTPDQLKIGRKHMKRQASDNQSQAQLTTLGGYKFGSIKIASSTENRASNLSDESLWTAAQDKLSKPWEDDDWSDMEMRVCAVIRDWISAHADIRTYVPSVRCVCVTLIHSAPAHTHTYLHVGQVEVVCGSGWRVVGGHKYDLNPTGNPSEGAGSGPLTLQHGGWVCMFAWGETAEGANLALVQMKIATSAFEACVGSRRHLTRCEMTRGFRGGLLEQAYDEWWSRFTIAWEGEDDG